MIGCPWYLSLRSVLGQLHFAARYHGVNAISKHRELNIRGRLEHVNVFPQNF
jgi:hypothetical protein